VGVELRVQVLGFFVFEVLLVFFFFFFLWVVSLFAF